MLLSELPEPMLLTDDPEGWGQGAATASEARAARARNEVRILVESRSARRGRS